MHRERPETSQEPRLLIICAIYTVLSLWLGCSMAPVLCGCIYMCKSILVDYAMCGQAPKGLQQAEDMGRIEHCSPLLVGVK